MLISIGLTVFGLIIVYQAWTFLDDYIENRQIAIVYFVFAVGNSLMQPLIKELLKLIFSTRL